MKKNQLKKEAAIAALVTYWFLAGSTLAAIGLKRDGEIGVATLVGVYATGGVLLPIGAVCEALIALDKVKIKIK